MADPNLSQANWNLRWSRAGMIVGLWKVLRELRKRCSETATRVYNDNDFNGNFSAGTLSLTGGKIGTNTSAEGYCYVRVTGGPTFTVSLYSATGASGKVAEGTATVGNVATLTEQNSSGLSGSVTLAASVSTETDDVHKVLVFPDFKSQINNQFSAGVDRDGEMEQVLLGTVDFCASQLQTAMDNVRSAFDQLLVIQLGPTSKSGAEENISRATTEDDGAISVTFEGLLEDLRLASKNNNASATPQEVVKAVVSSGAISYESGNVGAGTTPTPTVYEWQEGGTWSFVCTDATIGAQKFEGRFSPSNSDRAHLVYTSGIPLTMKKAWKDPGPEPSGDLPRIGVKSLTVDYARVITNTSGTGLSTTAADWSETGEDSDNSDSGVWYVTVSANGGNFDIAFYSDSNKPASSKVAEATNIAADTAFTASQSNRSGLTITGKTHASIADADTSTVDMKVFDTDGRTDGDPDRFECTVTETSIGKGQEFFAEAYNYYMNSDSSGSETVDEDYWTRGSGALLIP